MLIQAGFVEVYGLMTRPIKTFFMQMLDDRKISTGNHMKTTSKIALVLVNVLMLVFAIMLIKIPTIMQATKDSTAGMDTVTVTYTNVKVEHLRTYQEPFEEDESYQGVKSEWLITYNKEYDYHGQHYIDSCEEIATTRGDEKKGYHFMYEDGDTDIYAIFIDGDKKTMILQSSEDDISAVRLMVWVMAGGLFAAIIVIDVITVWVVRSGTGIQRK